MAAVDIIAAPKPNFTVDINISCSPEKIGWNSLHGALSAPPTTSRFTAPPTLLAHDADGDNKPFFPDLPPLVVGRPEVHLRNGIMKAARASAAYEPDAERAFFVADLSQVYLQHLRWKKNLPEIEPFYGTCCGPFFYFRFVD
jgi:ornithine decarboxylase